MNVKKIIGGDLIALYHDEKRINKLWRYNAKAVAGNLIERHGIAALAVANELMDGSSEQLNLFYRKVIGVLQDEFLSEG